MIIHSGTPAQVKAACQWIQDHLSSRLFEPAPVHEPQPTSPSVPELEQSALPEGTSTVEVAARDDTKAKMV